MKYLSLFSGVGGFELGIQKAYGDWRDSHPRGAYGGVQPCIDSTDVQGPACIGYSEIDRQAIKTYEKNFNGHKNYGDTTKIDTRRLPDFDLLVGGFPCQSFSLAGKRRGFDDTRGTLFFEVARILRDKRPRHLVLENVKGLLSHDGGKTFAVILGVLADLGYSVEWQILNSKHFGVPQNRERIYIVGHLAGECTRQILPITGGEQENNKTRNNDERGAQAFIKTRHLSQNGSLISPSTTLQASELPHIVQLNPNTSQDYRVYSPDGISPTISHGAGAGGAVVPTGIADRGRNGQAVWEPRKDGLANTLRTAGGRGSTPHIIDGKRITSKTARGVLKKGYTGALETRPVLIVGGIRRLTPIECERLQGFADNWTAGVSDTQRYKQMGNAVTVNVVAAVVERLLG